MTAPDKPRKGYSGFQVLVIVLVVVIASVGLTLFGVKYFLFAEPFQPVELSEQEEQQLEKKLERLQPAPGVSVKDLVEDDPLQKDEPTSGESLQPEPYSEEGAEREIHFTEREVNALLANNTNLARKMAIDLSEDLVSAKVLVPFDQDFPFLGGKTLRVRAGIELSSVEGKPVVRLKGISLMGVPLPNAWLGGIKGLDLVQEYGREQGFWKAFSAGIEDLSVREGELVLRLKK